MERHFPSIGGGFTPFWECCVNLGTLIAFKRGFIQFHKPLQKEIAPMLPWTKNKKKHTSRKSSLRSKLYYQTLERRQLLAVTASFLGGELTFTGDALVSGVEVELAVEAGTNHLVWRQSGGAFTSNLNTLGAPQAYVMSPPGTVPVVPINLTIDLGDGNDEIEFNLDSWTGLKNVTVVDGGDYDIDTVSIVSGLDLQPAGGELAIRAEKTLVSPQVLVAASGGISISGTGHDALIEIGENATLSTRTILPAVDHHADPSSADSGSISLTSKTISVADDVSILAFVEDTSPFNAGDVEMRVSEELPTSFEFYDLLNGIATGSVSWAEAFNLFDQTATATIDIGAADIRASSISMEARVDTDSVIPTINEIQDAVLSGGGPLLTLQMFSDYLSGELTEFLVATGAFAAWRATETTTAIVRVGDHAILEADRDIVMSAVTKSTENTEVDNEIQAFAVNIVESRSQVIIGEGGSLEAGNDISIATDVTIESLAKAQTAKNLGLQTGPDRTAIAVAFAKSFLHSNILVAENATLHSGSDLILHAKGDQVVSADAGAGVHLAGGLGITFAVALPTADVTVDVHGSLQSDCVFVKDAGIIIHAELETNEQAIAMSGLGGAAAPAAVPTLSQPVQQFLNTFIYPIINGVTLNNLHLYLPTNFDLSTSTAVIESANNVDATVHGSSSLRSGKDLSVESDLVARVRTFAESVVEQDPVIMPVGDVVSVATTVGLFVNQSTATIRDGAVLDAVRDLSIHASSVYPYHKPLILVEEGGTRTIEIDGNSWARSHSVNGRADFAGSVSYQDYETLTTAVVGDGVLVNQSADYASPVQSVSVTADSDLYTLDIAGLFELVVDVTAITNTAAFQTAFVNGGLLGLLAALDNAAVATWNNSDIDFGAGSEKTAVGGSYANVRIDNETTASIGDSVLLNTGLDGHLIVDADAQVHQYSFAVSGLEGGKAGIAGSWARNQHKNHTTARIGIGGEIVAGDIAVTSNSELLAMGFGGGVLQGGNYGVGVSVGSNDVDRMTNAYIGSLSDSAAGGSITARGLISVTANNDGGVFSFALSGSRQAAHLNPASSTHSTGGLWTDLTSITLSSGEFGVGFSGDAAINQIEDHAHAFINGTAVIESIGVNVAAIDSTAVVAAAGAATLAADVRSWGLAGSFAYNDVNGSIRAWVSDANVTVASAGVMIKAERGSGAGVWAATASAALSKGWFAAAVNVSWNRTQWNTEAMLHDAVIISGGSVMLSAQDRSITASIAAAAAWGADYGFGGSFSLNEMNGTTETKVHGSVLEVRDNLTLESRNNAKIISASGSYGGSKAFVFAVTAAWNQLHSKAAASILESSVTVGEDVLVDARDSAEILSVAGAVSAYQGSGFGGAFALNQLSKTVFAEIGSTEVVSDGSVEIRSVGDSEIKAYAVGVAGQEYVGLAGSLVINRIDSDVTSCVWGSDLTALSRVLILSDSERQISTVAGGFAGAGSVAVGAAVGLNETNANVSSRAWDSQIVSDGPVSVLARGADTISAMALGGAGAEFFSLGGGVSINRIQSDTSAAIDAAVVTSALDCTLLAEDHSELNVLSGAGSGSKFVGIGAGVSVNEVEANVDATVSDSQIASGEGISIVAQSELTIEAWAIGGAGAQSFSAGGGVATNDIASTVAARVLDSTMDTGGDVELLAENRSHINVIAGGAAGAFGLGVGAGVSLNEVQSTVESGISSSQIMAGRDVSVVSRGAGAIHAKAFGGAGAQAFALGGGVATNDLRSNVNAFVVGSFVDAGRDAHVSAINQDIVDVLTGGFAGAGAVAVGAGVSFNEIASNVDACVADSQIATDGDVSITAQNLASIQALAIGGAGASTFALGGSVAVNQVSGQIRSWVTDESELVASGNVSVLTADTSQIHVIAPGVAGAGNVAVGIAVVENEINRTLVSHVLGSLVDAGHDVNVEVSSRSDQIALAVSGAISSTVAVTGSSSNNSICQEVLAAVDGDSVVIAGNDVGIRSHVLENIDTDVVSVAATGGFSVAGAMAYSHLDTVSHSRVGSQSVINALGNVSVECWDETMVDSLVGEAGIGTGAAGLGAGIGIVQIDKDVQAYVDEDAVVSAVAANPGVMTAYSGEHDANGNLLLKEIRGVEVQATSKEFVQNQAFGIDGGQAFGVAAAVTLTVIEPRVEAWIGRNASVDADSAGTPTESGEKSPTNVNVAAVNHSNVLDRSWGAGIGGLGAAGAADIGIVNHFVWGHIDSDAEVNALYDIDVYGLSTKDITTNTIGVGAGLFGLDGSASVWNLGAELNADFMLGGATLNVLELGGVSVDQAIIAVADFVDHRLHDWFGIGCECACGINADLNDLEQASGVLATIDQDATLIAGDDIDVVASEWVRVDARTGGLGIGGLAGVGAAVGIINLHSDTDENVFGHVRAGDQTRVQATLEESVDTRSLAGSLAAVSGSGAVSVVNESSEQTASIAKGAWVEATDQLLVNADEALTVNVSTGQAGVGVLDGGASIGQVHATGLTEAYISDAVIGSGNGAGTGGHGDPSTSQVRVAEVKADVVHELVSDVEGLNLAGVSLTEFVAAIDDAHQVKAWVGEGAQVLLADNLLVATESEINGESTLYGLAGSIIEVASPRILAQMMPNIATFIENAHVHVGNDVDVSAVNHTRAYVAEDFSGMAGLSCGSLVAESNAVPEVNTYVAGKETSMTAGGNVVIESRIEQDAVVQIVKAASSLVVVGETEASANATGEVLTHVGDGARLNVGNDFHIRSEAAGASFVDVYAFSLSLGDVYDNIANADASFNAEARLGSVDGLWVMGDTLVESVTNRDAKAHVDAEGGGGYTAGHANVTSRGNGSSEAVVEGKIDATGNLIVRANETNKTVSDAVSAGLSLVSATSLESHTDARPVVTAVITADVSANGNVDVLANADIKTHSHGRAVGFAFASLGQTRVGAKTEPWVTAELKGQTLIQAAGDVTVHAAQATESAFAGQPTVLGEGATVGLLYNGAGMTLFAHSTPYVRAHVDRLAVVQDAPTLVINAVSDDDVSVVDHAAGGGLLSKGEVSGEALTNGEITSTFMGAVDNVGNLILNAEADAMANSTVAVGVGGGVVTGGAEGIAGVEPEVSAKVDSDLNVTGDVQIVSSSRGDATTIVFQESTGLVFSGEMISDAFVRPTVESVIAEGKRVSADGEIELVAIHNMSQTGDIVPLGARAVTGGVVDGALTESQVFSNAESDARVSSRAENLSQLVAGQNLLLSARCFNDAEATANGMAVGAGGNGSIEATADALGSAETLLDGVDFVTVNNGDLVLLAQSRNDADASAVAAGGGVIAYVNAASADATSAPDVTARVEAKSGMHVERDVKIVSLGAGDVRADAEEKSKGGLYNKGAVVASGAYRPTVESLIAENTSLIAGRDVVLAAYGNALDESGAFDTARGVQVSSLSRGSALVVGRESRSDAEVVAVVSALLGDHANVQAGNDALIEARSYTWVDVDAFTRLFGLIGSAWAYAHDVSQVSTLTGSQKPYSVAGFTLTAGNDVDVISDSYVETESDAEAGAVAFGGSMPVVTSTVQNLDTLAILGDGSTTVAGDEIFVFANKLLYQTSSSTVFGIGVVSATTNYTAETDAIIYGGASSVTAPTITVWSNDPVIARATATVVDDNISDKEWHQAVKEGRIGAEASVAGDVLIISGIGKGVTVNSDKVRVINQLQKLDTSANAEVKTRRKHDIGVLETEALNLEIHTQLQNDAQINRELLTDPENAIGYRAELKINKKGRVSEKEKFREFGGRRGNGKATAASIGFETKKEKRTKDYENVDLFFGLLGRDVNGYGS